MGGWGVEPSSSHTNIYDGASAGYFCSPFAHMDIISLLFGLVISWRLVLPLLSWFGAPEYFRLLEIAGNLIDGIFDRARQQLQPGPGGGLLGCRLAELVDGRPAVAVRVAAVPASAAASAAASIPGRAERISRNI